MKKETEAAATAPIGAAVAGLTDNLEILRAADEIAAHSPFAGGLRWTPDEAKAITAAAASIRASHAAALTE